MWFVCGLSGLRIVKKVVTTFTMKIAPFTAQAVPLSSLITPLRHLITPFNRAVTTFNKFRHQQPPLTPIYN